MHLIRLITIQISWFAVKTSWRWHLQTPWEMKAAVPSPASLNSFTHGGSPRRFFLSNKRWLDMIHAESTGVNGVSPVPEGWGGTGPMSAVSESVCSSEKRLLFSAQTD